MKRTTRWVLVLVMLLLTLSACAEKETPYSGKPLTIGVIGELPEIETDQITLKPLSLNELTEETARTVDGVLVMEDQLAEASKEEYVDLYKEAHVPFFFIESKMGLLPFLEKSLAYSEENFDSGFDPDYAYGLHMTEEDNLESWSFGLLDDQENEKSIEDVFTRIFKSIGGEPIDLVEPENKK